MHKRNSINEMYLSIRNNLFRAVSRIVPPHEIEDVVQETYVRLCQVGNFENIRNPRSYMFKIVRNLALDHVKRAEHRLSVPWDEDPEAGYTGANIESDDVFQQSAAREEFVLFCEAVRKLPAQCRRVFVLKKVYGYSQLEIAEELGLSESTVEKHVALGVRRCHKFMNDRASSSSGSINPLGANRG